jgi:hypothetical protein
MVSAKGVVDLEKLQVGVGLAGVPSPPRMCNSNNPINSDYFSKGQRKKEKSAGSMKYSL